MEPPHLEHLGGIGRSRPGPAAELQPAAPHCLEPGLEPGAGGEPVKQFADAALHGPRMRAEAADDGSVGKAGGEQAEQCGFLLAGAGSGRRKISVRVAGDLTAREYPAE